jgi:hypothetical protein
MAKIEELKDLLKKLKSEVSYSEKSPSLEAGLDFKNRLIAEQGRIFESKPRPFADARLQKTPAGIDKNKIPFNVVWSENKETVLFGIMASVLVILAGIIASTDYLVLVGAVGFLLFVFIMFLLMFYYAASLRKGKETNINVDNIDRRIDELERKISVLSYQKGSQMGWSKEKELEGKIEELRTIVKSISKSITEWE